MASLIFKELKGVSFSCASPTSTAICTNFDHRSVVLSSSGRAIDRHSPHLRDYRRSKSISQLYQSSSLSSLQHFFSSMASLIFKELKGVSFSCASPTSTAICTNFDHRSMVRSSSGRAIDRHSPHLRDYRRSKSISQLYQSSSSSSKTRPSSYNQKKQTRFISPPASSRYLLDDKSFFDVFPDSVPPPPPPPLRPSLLRPSSSSRHQDQEVVLRVSLHCKGCEGKVRRHISKMEGVRSFSIDLAEKKVTVIGDVTPLGVLNSVSKVKNAQFWPSGIASPARASASF